MSGILPTLSLLSPTDVIRYADSIAGFIHSFTLYHHFSKFLPDLVGTLDCLLRVSRPGFGRRQDDCLLAHGQGNVHTHEHLD